MKTMIKELRHSCSAYHLGDLENEAEIAAIIREAEGSLLPCPHCGHRASGIAYSFLDPGMDGVRLKEKGSNEYAPTINPHKVFVLCRGLLPDRTYCYMRTSSLYAEDEESDIREALRILCKTWNSRSAV